MGVPIVMGMPGAAVAHEEFDHPAPGFVPGDAPLSTEFNSGTAGDSPGLGWDLITTIPTGNPHTDIEFFTQTVKTGDVETVETFASVGTLATGPNAGGQSIVQLTRTNDKGEQRVDPSFFSAHPSATCITDASQALGLQHDVEASPKGDTINNGSYLPPGVTADAQIIIDATDNPGRCHDQGDGGLIAAPQGGLEIVDVTNLRDPAEIGLTSHIGESHTVNVDPKRPHIAYSITSDSVSVSKDSKDLDKDGDVEELIRNNQDPSSSQRFNLDGFEVVDLSSCMNVNDRATFAPDATLEEKRAGCRPEVFRYRFPSLDMQLGHTQKTSVFGCHELEIYPDDRLTCGGGQALSVFDMAGAFNDNGTPENFTDDTVNGTALDCSVRESSTVDPVFDTAAMVTDCVRGGADGKKDLTVPAWLADGEPGLKDSVKHIGSIFHQGRGGPFPATEDVDFNHESEFTRSGEFLLATDERGGGVLTGAQCSPGNPIAITNGGVNAFQVDQLRTGENRPETAEEAFEAYARGTDGKKSIFRAPVRTGAEPTFCTAHVMQQVPGENRIFMGWYTQGTQVIDYVELPDGRLEFVEDARAQEGSETTSAQAPTEQAGFFIPQNANEWVSHVFRKQDNGDGTITYFGATGDFNLTGESGRNAIDVYKVTLPAPADACTLAPESTVTDREAAREVHRPSIDCALQYEIANGKGDGSTYAPGENVTRGQMATFVLNAINAAGSGAELSAATGADEFSDLGEDPTHRASINKLAELGIISGTGGGKFSPQATITRAQMATFVTQAARFVTGETIDADSDHFSDEGSTHAANINAGFERGYFSGTSAPTEGAQGSFSPETVVQRDQMASFLTNVFTRTITQDELTGRAAL
jgi:hypothetical protein